MTSTHSKIIWHTQRQHNTSRDQQQTAETNLHTHAVLEFSDVNDEINYYI